MTKNPWNLTPVQTQIIDAVTKFGRVKVVAGHLNMSTSAVQNHLNKVRKKMGVCDVTLAALAWDRHVRGGK